MIKKRLKTLKKTYFLVKNNISLKNSIKKLILIFLFFSQYYVSTKY